MALPAEHLQPSLPENWEPEIKDNAISLTRFREVEEASRQVQYCTGFSIINGERTESHTVLALTPEASLRLNYGEDVWPRVRLLLAKLER